MPLLLQPTDISINYFAEFKEPQLSQLKEDSRISLAQKLTTKFDLRLSDLKYDPASISDKFVRFSKLINRTFFDVSFGLEQISATLNNPADIGQVEKLFGLLFELFEGIPIKLQRYIVQQQSTTEGDTKAFLQKLIPYSPDKLQNFISGRGVTYQLLFQDHNLSVFITVSDSIILEKGIFLYVQLDFSPNKYDPYETFQLAKERYNFMLKELDLSVSPEEA
jgi:hypothetical protein